MLEVAYLHVKELVEHLLLIAPWFQFPYLFYSLHLDGVETGGNRTILQVCRIDMPSCVNLGREDNLRLTVWEFFQL